MPKQRVTLKKLWDAIRKQCLECVAGQTGLIATCPSKNCPLFAYRFGYHSKASVNPLKKGRLVASECHQRPQKRVENEKLDI